LEIFQPVYRAALHLDDEDPDALHAAMRWYLRPIVDSQQ
jgi:hypothetical protein